MCIYIFLVVFLQPANILKNIETHTITDKYYCINSIFIRVYFAKIVR